MNYRIELLKLLANAAGSGRNKRGRAILGARKLPFFDWIFLMMLVPSLSCEINQLHSYLKSQKETLVRFVCRGTGCRRTHRPVGKPGRAPPTARRVGTTSSCPFRITFLQVVLAFVPSLSRQIKWSILIRTSRTQGGVSHSYL